MSTTTLAGAVDLDVKGLVQLNGFHTFLEEGTAQFGNGAPLHHYNTNAYLQLVRLGLVGQINDDWSFVVTPLDYRYARSVVVSLPASPDLLYRYYASSIEEASVSYTGFKPLNLKLGIFRPSYGFENATANENLAFPFRSAIAQLLSSQPGLGLEVSGHQAGLTYAVSAHVPTTLTDQSSKSIDEKDWPTVPNPGFNARVTYGTQWAEHGIVVHMGASLASVGSEQKLGWDIVGHQKYSYVLPVQLLRTSIVTTPPLLLSNEHSQYGIYFPRLFFTKRFAVMGVEVAVQKGPFSAYAEYHYTKPEGLMGSFLVDSSAGTLKVRGFSFEAGYVISGETRPYCECKGVFTNVIPHSTTGAWEIVARLDQIKLENFRLGEVQEEFKKTAYTVGLNYYLNSYATVKLHYALDCITGSSINDTKLHAISLGTQFSF